MIDKAHDSKKPYTRAREVMKHLSLYGPLHLHTIEQLMKPVIKRKRLQDVLLRLLRRGFIFKRGEKALHAQNIYYEISKSEMDLELAANFMKISVDDLRQPYFRTQELLHAQYCAVWADKLRHLYPDAVVVPDYKIPHNKEAKNILQLQHKERDIYPDLLLIFPRKEIKPRVGVAVEIERTRKSSKRLVKKITKYANLTLLDGVLYVCEERIIADTISNIFKSKVWRGSYRIQHYSENFFMFSFLMGMGKMPLNEIFNLDGEDTLLQNWIHYLREIDHYDRDNHCIENRANVPQQNEIDF